MAEIKFEKALEKLETIVDELETGDFPLDESLKKYEDGIKLASTCQKQLDKAKDKIETLIKNSDGSFEAKPFRESE